ncbi:hypothetical protein ACGF12_13645 [Kitasatospora sp. NPDC048296]|uniref:hypothetical protein n=1 Tax=Kitasatospora sp. NPDC048296 TaxID=3364048 RepID=UPI0037165F0F
MSDKRFLAFGRIEKGTVTRNDVSVNRVGASREVPPRGKADRAARRRGATVPPVEIRQV